MAGHALERERDWRKEAGAERTVLQDICSYAIPRNRGRKMFGMGVMAQSAAHQEGAQAQGEAQPLVPQAPKPPIVYRRRIRTRR
jgi:hypothetical protein